MAPLDDLYTDEVKDDLFGGLVTKAQVDGALRRYAGVDQLGDLVLSHRPLRGPDQPGRLRSEVRLPARTAHDWEQYRDIAEFFTRDTDGDGQIDLYGTESRAPSKRSGSRPCPRPAKSTWCSTRKAGR